MQLTAVEKYFSVDGLIKSTVDPITPCFFLENTDTHTRTQLNKTLNIVKYILQYFNGFAKDPLGLCTQ